MKKNRLGIRLLCLLAACTLCVGLVGFVGAPLGASSYAETIVKVASGANHTLALLSDGTVWSWGKNDSGQLGDGTLAMRTLPIRVTLPDTAVDIAAGSSHSMAALSDGTLYAWGANEKGQLGDGTTGNRNRPVKVQNIEGANALAAGFAHSLAIGGDGTLYAWGYNIYGQLGMGNNSNVTAPRPVKYISDEDTDGDGVKEPRPQPTTTLLAAGYNHTLAYADGQLYAFGYNLSGELCDGTYVNRNSPAAINELPGAPTALYAGTAHSLALVGDMLYGWGSNKYGQLDPQRDIPTYNHPLLLMSGVAAPHPDAATVAAGSSHTAVILDTPAPGGETVKIWGNNGWGQLGNDTSGHVNGTHLLADLPGQSLASGHNSMFVLDTDNVLWAFGYNGFGQLGDGSFQQRVRPVSMDMKSFFESVAPVSGLTLTPSVLDWCIGEPYTGFVTRLLPANAYNTDLEWSVNYPAVADIDRDTGVLVGRKAGAVTVTAKAYTGLVAKCSVVIKPDPAMVVITTSPRHMVNVGNTLKLAARLTPDDAYNGKVVWEIRSTVNENNDPVSVDPADIGAVAQVDPRSGVLTSLGTGFVLVRAASEMNPNIYDEIVVECGFFARAVDIRLDDDTSVPEYLLHVNMNTNPMESDTVHLNAVVMPDDRAKQDVAWRSSNENIATVDATGLVTALKSGSCTISALTHDGSARYGICRITVEPLAIELLLNTQTLKLPLGEKFLFKATAAPSSASQAVDWSVEELVSDTGDPVLSLSATGVAKGLSPGTARVTATAKDGSGKTAVCLIEVVVPVTRVTLQPTVMELNADNPSYKTKQIDVSFLPPSASYPQVDWTTSNANVAVVSSSGLVTAMGPGTCKILATAADGSGRSAGATVTVKSNADAMSLNYAVYPTLAVEKTLSLRATVYPLSSDQAVTWRLSDDSPGGVATVTDRGVVRAFGAGTVTVIAASKANPSISATCVVTCVVPVSELRVAPSSIVMAVEKVVSGGVTTVVPAAAQIAVSMQPYDHTNTVVSCISSNPLVADADRDVSGVTLSPQGYATVNARAVGTATLTFIIDGKRATLRVTVRETPAGVRIIPPPGTLIYRGKPLVLKATVTPSTADQSLEWTSDNQGVATVDEKGVVRAVSAGTVTIRAQVPGHDDLYDQLTFDCQIPVTSVKIEKTAQTLLAGETSELTVTVNPTDAYLGPSGWLATSSKDTVAAVQKTADDGGIRVTAVAPGTAVITVKVGDRLATVNVTVKAVPTGLEITNKPSSSFLLLRGVNTLTLRARVLPATAFQNIDWSSSDESIATVKDGAVTVRGKGTVTITATCPSNPDLYDETDINCDLPVTSLRLSSTSLGLKLADGASELTVTLNPGDAYVAPGKELSARVISGASVIALSDGGGGVYTVTPQKTGTATISFSCGGKNVTCKVTVK